MSAPVNTRQRWGFPSYYCHRLLGFYLVFISVEILSTRNSCKSEQNSCFLRDCSFLMKLQIWRLSLEVSDMILTFSRVLSHPFGHSYSANLCYFGNKEMLLSTFSAFTLPSSSHFKATYIFFFHRELSPFKWRKCFLCLWYNFKATEKLQDSIRKSCALYAASEIVHIFFPPLIIFLKHLKLSCKHGCCYA